MVEAVVSPLIQITATAESFTRVHRFLQVANRANDWVFLPSIIRITAHSLKPVEKGRGDLL